MQRELGTLRTAIGTVLPTSLKTCAPERYDMTVVVNEHVALLAAQESVPDLVVSDVMMPELDYWAILSGAS